MNKPVSTVSFPSGSMPVNGSRPAPAPEPAPIAEAVVETPPAESDGFAALARQTKQFRDQQRQFESDKLALEAEKLKYQTGYVSEQDLISKTLEVLRSKGIPDEKLAQMLVDANDPNKEILSKVEQRLLDAEKKLETKLNEDRKKQQDADYQSALKQVENQVNKLVSTNPDLETIKSMGAQGAVVKYIEERYQLDGTLLSAEEAAKEVEEHLLKTAISYAGLSKVKQKMAPPEVVAAPTKKIQTINTITNQALSSPSKATKSDRMARAVAAFNGFQK